MWFFLLDSKNGHQQTGCYTQSLTLRIFTVSSAIYTHIVVGVVVVTTQDSQCATYSRKHIYKIRRSKLVASNEAVVVYLVVNVGTE